MKLYLSSYRIPVPEAFNALLPAAPKKTKFALIPNAKDYYAPRAWSFKVQDFLEYAKDLGFKPHVFDLRFHSPKTVKAKLEKFDCVWAMGGNTFCLRHEMQRSGFDKVIQELVEDGLVFGGDSAGALVAGPSLKGVDLADEPEFADEVITDGLSIIPTVVIPHADNQEFQETVREIVAIHQEYPYKVILNDNQAFVVDGEATQIVTGQ